MHSQHLFATLALTLPALVTATVSQMGCYSSVPGLKDEGDFTFQSLGYCQEKCEQGGFRIAALTGGTQCLCGNEFPPSSALVDDDKCDLTCPGWPEDECGGNDYYNVLSIGEYIEVSDSSSASSTSVSSTSASASTIAGGIIVAPTNLNPSSVPTAILTATDSLVTSASASVSASTSAIASKSVVAAAITSVSSSASASPTVNAANAMHAGSSVIGAAIAGLGLLL
ncbi:uncharacterized protein N7477_006859 [Penicillium maclennaniae]|uniref:uncharacterized protein n=1 Tax=Penicillium maclennaniae TaxID=1343394 RepID=UPI002541AB92|nr:uncharacterized protein N7477_006859 [Penicillium maclennaniae]KAJ5668289.1 hypothetical protein N7477_006859 [Penicillium maclennaniae]